MFYNFKIKTKKKFSVHHLIGTPFHDGEKRQTMKNTNPTDVVIVSDLKKETIENPNAINAATSSSSNRERLKNHNPPQCCHLLQF